MRVSLQGGHKCGIVILAYGSGKRRVRILGFTGLISIPGICQNCLVRTAPVILQLALPPFLPECLTTADNSLFIIEIPFIFSCLGASRVVFGFSSFSFLFQVDNYLYIKAQYVQNKYIPERIDIVLNSVELLQDVKDTVIQSLLIEAPVTSVDKELIGDLDSLTSRDGNTTLKFIISDLSSGDKASLISGRRKIMVTEELVNYLDRRGDLAYSFNQ